MEESSGFKSLIRKSVDSAELPLNLFQLVSRKAWLDVLLQLLKICVLNRITPKSLKLKEVPYNDKATFPFVKADPLISNVFYYFIFLNLVYILYVTKSNFTICFLVCHEKPVVTYSENLTCING